jgi:hypothetical protein
MLVYNLDFFNNLNNKPITLSTEILNKITKLQNELHIDTTVVEPKRLKRQKKSVENMKNPDFKCTVIKKTEGDEKIYSDIRSCLNKLSEKNYDSQIELLIENINLLLETKSEKYNILSVIELILDISSGNSYLSKLYAKIWKHLLNLYGDNNYHDLIFNRYNDLVNTIDYIDPNIDYDKHCKINKINDKRRNITTFIVNLVEENLITNDKCIYLINNIIDDIENNIIEDIPEYKNDELVEILKVFVINSQSILKTDVRWKSIQTYIIEMSKKKKKDINGISARTLFKFMDIRDNIV